MIGAAILHPTHEMMQEVCGSIDLMEVACSTKSALTTEFEKAGYQCERIHYLAGYNLDRKSGTRKAVDRMRERKPRMTWISMPCTRLSSLQNLTERTPAQWEEFQRRQQADLRRSDEIADGVVEWSLLKMIETSLGNGLQVLLRAGDREAFRGF